MDYNKFFYIAGIGIGAIVFLGLIFWLSLNLVSILVQNAVVLPFIIMIVSAFIGIYSAISGFSKKK